MIDFHTPHTETGGWEMVSPATLDDLIREAIPLLKGIAMGRFQMNEDDADSLVHSVLVQFLPRASEVRDPRAYLVASIMNGARRFLAAPRNEVSIDEIAEPEQPTPDADQRILVRQILDQLDDRCRDVLRMHYLSGQTTREMAHELDTTPGYAQKLVHKCLTRALEICRKMKVTRAL